MSLALLIALNLELRLHIVLATTQVLATRNYKQEDTFIVERFFSEIILGRQFEKTAIR